ncbi:hypothetical protein ABT039_22480 [Streptomyces lasiicapitis]|uniref:hypothetical protein n=1 Tax=Streptomyces lasiicapitis TaxID=1923961 RepID=UPI00331DB3EC
MTPEERGHLAEHMLAVAGRLSAYVHGDGGPEDIQRLLEGLDEQQRMALLVVLAGLINPDAPVVDALRWLEFNEHGEAIVPELPGWRADTTLRDLAEELPLETASADIDEVAVERFLAGEHTIALTRAERLQVIIAGREQGMTYLELDILFGHKHGSAQKALIRARHAASARGEVLEVKVPVPVLLTEQQVVAMRRASVDGAEDADLALAYGLSRPAVSRVVTGQTYTQYGGPRRTMRSHRSARWASGPDTRAPQRAAS